jgi:hypothetical protein
VLKSNFLSETLFSSSNNAAGNITTVVGGNLGQQTPMTSALNNANALATMNMAGMNQMNVGLASAMMASQGMVS